MEIAVEFVPDVKFECCGVCVGPSVKPLMMFDKSCGRSSMQNGQLSFD